MLVPDAAEPSLRTGAGRDDPPRTRAGRATDVHEEGTWAGRLADGVGCARLVLDRELSQILVVLWADDGPFGRVSAPDRQDIDTSYTLSVGPTVPGGPKLGCMGRRQVDLLKFARPPRRLSLFST